MLSEHTAHVCLLSIKSFLIQRNWNKRTWVSNREAENRAHVKVGGDAETEEKRWRISRGRNNTCELEKEGRRERGWERDTERQRGRERAQFAFQ